MWKTTITKIDNEKYFVKGYELTELMESCTFGDMILLMATGKMPYLHQGEVMESILVACCDQGPLPPSTNATRFVASCGVPLQAAVAAGILGIGDHHGGAIESCAKLLQENILQNKKRDYNALAEKITEDFSAQNIRIPGFGHAYVEIDQRAVKLLEIARKKIHPHPHIELLLAMEKKLTSKKGTHLATNINGAVAAVISDLGVDWRMGKGIFIMSRSLGLVAHALEEMKLGKPYKKIPKENIDYDGPEKKELPIRLEPS